MNLSMNKTIATLALVMMTTAVTFATGSVSIPHVFTAGQTALANDVNENFQALLDAIKHVHTHFDGPDDYTITPITGAALGTRVTIGSDSAYIGQDSSVSFDPTRSTTYSITKRGGGDASAPTSFESEPTLMREYGPTVKKTTISGYPALTDIYVTSQKNIVGRCRAVIKLDDYTYYIFQHEISGQFTTLPADPANGLLERQVPIPVTKEERTAVTNTCKEIYRYLNVTAQ